MFTGIIEALGEVVSLRGQDAGARLRVDGGALLRGVRVGDSIAVSGVCLTMDAIDESTFTADLAAETLRRTTLGALQPRDAVNLERPLRVDGRLSGHLVQGHIDGVGTIASIQPQGDGVWMEITSPEALLPYVVEKGSIAVDGVSLTVAGLGGGGRIAVALIPHTLAATTLGRRRPGDGVNLEVDIVAKYVERLVGGAGRR